jgi:hypothetical protein
MPENKTIERLPVNEEFARPANPAAIERTAEERCGAAASTPGSPTTRRGLARSC